MKYINNNYYISYLLNKIKNYFKKNGKKIIKTIGLQLLFLSFIIGLVAPISIYLYNNQPRKYLSKIKIDGIDNEIFDPRNMSTYDPMEETPNVYFNPHTHTIISDGEVTPELTLKWHIANGYNVMFITDHNKIDGGKEGEILSKTPEFKDKIIVIPGIEWTNCRCHLGLLGIDEDIHPIKYPTDEEIQHVIKKVHDMGGVVVMNHRPWSYFHGLHQPSLEDWLKWGIDFFEVLNEDYFDYQTLVFCKKNNIGYLGGIDFHLNERATKWNVLNIPNAKPLLPNEPISSVVPSLNKEMIMNALRNKSAQISFIYDVIGSNIAPNTDESKLNPTYVFLSPWIYIGNFFHSFFELRKGVFSFVDGPCYESRIIVYTDRIVSLVTWIFILFFICQIIYFSTKKLSKFIKKRINGKKKSFDNKNMKEDFEKSINQISIPHSSSSYDNDSNSDVGSSKSDDPLKKQINNKMETFNDEQF